MDSGGAWLLELIKAAGGVFEAASLLMIVVVLIISWTVFRTRSALARQTEANAKQQEAITERFQRADDERVSLAKQVQLLNTTNADLHRKLEETLDLARSLTAQLETGRANINNLQAAITALKDETTALKREVANLQSQKHSVEEQLEREKLRTVNQQHEIDGLRGKVAELERKVAELTGANAALQGLLQAWRPQEDKPSITKDTTNE